LWPQGISLERPSFIITQKALKAVIIVKRMLVTINDPPYEILERMARIRGMSVQMVLRTIVIPQWLQEKSLRNPMPEPLPEIVAAEPSDT
jgi:hypothetical protein